MYHKECETEDGYGVCPACPHWHVRSTCDGCEFNDSFSVVNGFMRECVKPDDCYCCDKGFDWQDRLEAEKNEKDRERISEEVREALSDPQDEEDSDTL